MATAESTTIATEAPWDAEAAWRDASELNDLGWLRPPKDKETWRRRFQLKESIDLAWCQRDAVAFAAALAEFRVAIGCSFSDKTPALAV